jgi:hypothetical protein
MRKATKAVAMWMGIVAGIGGLEHGYFEILQGNIRPDNLAFFSSMGPPCDPEVAWSACEPAMTILPNLLITGILALIFGLAVLIWSTGFLQRRHGGLVLILLSIGMLLFGGGFFPPLIGIVGGAAGVKIHKPIKRKQTKGLTRSVARLWPWPLVIFVVWTLGQIPFGYFCNDLLKSIMFYGIGLILTMLPVSVYNAYAHDVVEQGT